MAQTILTKNQQLLLSALSSEPHIIKNFILSGGTALAEFYLHHRLSEDLDFFSESEVDPQAIAVTLKKLKNLLKIKKIDFQQSFNRNLFFVTVGTETIKTEFTYYPFTPVENGIKTGQLNIDSLLDIAINKLFTIHQQPRSRDFIDLYCILCQKKQWTINSLSKHAQIKFDTYIDPLQLGSQLLKVKEVKDYPRMLIKLGHKTWQTFWLDVARLLKAKVMR